MSPRNNQIAKITADYDKLREEAGMKKRRPDPRRRKAPKPALSTGTQAPPELVALVRELRGEGITPAEISRRSGVARNTITAIIASHKIECGFEQLKRSISLRAMNLCADLLSQLEDDLPSVPARAIPTAAKLLADLSQLAGGQPVQISEVRHTIDPRALNESLMDYIAAATRPTPEVEDNDSAIEVQAERL